VPQLAVLIAALAACSAPRPVPELTPDLFARGEALGFARDELQLGRRTFTHACSECHARPDPLEVPGDGWETVLAVMIPKTGAERAESRALRAFVLTVASTRP
jgi:cytochrome c5